MFKYWKESYQHKKKSKIVSQTRGNKQNKKLSDRKIIKTHKKQND